MQNISTPALGPTATTGFPGLPSYLAEVHSTGEVLPQKPGEGWFALLGAGCHAAAVEGLAEVMPGTMGS